MSDKKKLLVTGASGKLAGKVVAYLLDDFQVAPADLIVTSRNVESLADLAARGVEVRPADFSDPESLVQAFQGVDSLLLTSIDAIGQRTQLHGNAVAAAAEAGVTHLSYTSMPAPETSPVVFAHEHVATEKAIAASPIPNWTILRNNWYFENLPEFFGSVLQTGAWLTSAAQGRSAQISREDLAYAAAASLVQSREGQTVFTLNGPESLTTEEMARTIDQVLGTSTEVVPLTDDELQAKLVSFQLPEGLVSMVVTMDQHGRGNFSDGGSEEYEDLTGKKPRTFRAWLEANKESLLALTRG